MPRFIRALMVAVVLAAVAAGGDAGVGSVVLAQGSTTLPCMACAGAGHG